MLRAHRTVDEPSLKTQKTDGESLSGAADATFFFNWLIFRTRGAPEGLKTKFVKMSADRLLSLSLFFLIYLLGYGLETSY